MRPHLGAFLLSVIVVYPAVAQLKAPPGYKERLQDQPYVFNGMPEGEWVNPPKPGSLPAGVTHRTYFSRAMGHDVGYSIYLPPQYEQEPSRRFPVIYHLHGISGNEIARLRNAQVLHDGIVAGKWPPMIMVFPNGRHRSHYHDWDGGTTLTETTIIKELIPTIDTAFRTIAGRHGRCIEGHSMGGRGSTFYALKYPNMFCSVFNQAGNVVRIADLYDLNRKDKFPFIMLGADKARYADNDPFQLLQKNLDQIRGKLRIQIMCGTADTTHLPTVREFHQALVEAKVDHTYIEVDQDYEAFRTGKKIHDLDRLIDQYKAVWFDYHVESLRRAAAAAKNESAQQE
jgi:enterochelin esterase-like enzyme